MTTGPAAPAPVPNSPLADPDRSPHAATPSDTPSDPDASPARPLADLLEPGTTIMVATMVDRELQFRPLTVARCASPDVEILLDTREEWVASLTQGTPVHVTLSDTRRNDWAHLHGSAALERDARLIDELWNPFAAAFFEEGRDTPGIGVLRVTVESGRYWSSPSGRLGSLIAVVRAALGSSESSGDAGPVDVAAD